MLDTTSNCMATVFGSLCIDQKSEEKTATANQSGVQSQGGTLRYATAFYPEDTLDPAVKWTGWYMFCDRAGRKNTLLLSCLLLLFSFAVLYTTTSIFLLAFFSILYGVSSSLKIVTASTFMPPENKDAAIFPTRLNGKWVMLHRPVSNIAGAKANIWISFSPDMKYWGEHKVLLYAREGGWWDARKIGLAPPPMKTSDGWLIMYYGVRQTTSKKSYRLGLALLDLEDPTKVLHRSEGWVFGPREMYERTGDVNDVVFPCGWILVGDELRIYYGSADMSVAMASAKMSDILQYIHVTLLQHTGLLQPSFLRPHNLHWQRFL